MKAISCSILLLMGVMFVSTLQAQTVKTDRYTRVKIEPSPGQISPLEEVTRIVFGDDVKTVGNAIIEVLDGSGYELRHIKDVYEKPIDSILMAQTLPELHRRLGPITIHDALEVLAGEAWHLKTNVLGRELWFVLNPHYSKDKVRLERLLKESDKSSGDENVGSVGNEFYVDFPPGNITRPKNISAFKQFVRAIDQKGIKEVLVQGQSYSKGKSGSLKLAKARAIYVQRHLVKSGVPVEKLKVTYNALNQQPESRSGVKILLKYEESGVVDPKTRVDVPTKKAERIVEAPTVYRFYRGEDLESALRRWVKRAGYVDLIWDVKDRDNHFVTIPISADAIFNCDFLECLSGVKKAYAEADYPRYFDITAKGGNQIVTIRLLHLNGNL